MKTIIVKLADKVYEKVAREVKIKIACGYTVGADFELILLITKAIEDGRDEVSIMTKEQAGLLGKITGGKAV